LRNEFEIGFQGFKFLNCDLPRSLDHVILTLLKQSYTTGAASTATGFGSTWTIQCHWSVKFLNF